MVETGETTLFIGGPWDGRREAVDFYHRDVLVPMAMGSDGEGRSVRFETIRYDRKVFHACGKQFVFRVSSGMTEAELMDRLVKGYQPAKEEPNV